MARLSRSSKSFGNTQDPSALLQVRCWQRDGDDDDDDALECLIWFSFTLSHAFRRVQRSLHSDLLDMGEPREHLVEVSVAFTEDRSPVGFLGVPFVELVHDLHAIASTSANGTKPSSSSS